MSADVAGKRRRHKRGALVWPPVLGKDPIHARLVGVGIGDVIWAHPGADLELVNVVWAGEVEVAWRDHFAEAVDQGKAGDVVVGERRVGALSTSLHPAKGRDRTDVVVPTFVAPRGNGRVVHGPTQGEVGADVVVKGMQGGALSHPTPLKVGVVHHAVEDGEPVPRRRLRIGAVGPKLRQHPRVIATGHHLRLIGLAGGGVDVPTLAGVAAFVPIVELVVFVVVEVEEGLVHVPHRGRADVHRHPVGGVEVLRPAEHHAVPPCVGIVDALGVVEVHQGRCTLVDPHGVRPAVRREVQGLGAVW